MLNAYAYSGGSVGKVPLAHQVVSLDDLVDVLAPDPDSDTHDHVLRTFSNLAIDTEEVRSLERLETELFCRYVFALDRHRQSSSKAIKADSRSCTGNHGRR
jgi:hypothetical protein